MQIGRWQAIDPLSEVSRKWSPYTYCYDNPMSFVDKDGMLATNSGGSTESFWDMVADTYNSLGNGGYASITPDGNGGYKSSTGIITSTKKDALILIGVFSGVIASGSSLFPNVNPGEFKANLITRVLNPTGLNQGQETNFCWSSVCMSYTYEKNPAGMVHGMVSLYKTGIFQYYNGTSTINVLMNDPCAREAIGSSVFDNNPPLNGNLADQMLLMALATHYKGYMNSLTKNYAPNAEEYPLWSGGNLTKVTQMRNDFGYNVSTSGSDITPGINPFTVKEDLTCHDVILFVNSGAFKNGKTGRNILAGNITGTHFIRLGYIHVMPNTRYMLEINYWDYGSWKTGTIYAKDFMKAVYGEIKIPK